LHESPERSIREIETHEVCPGRETAPGFFHVRDVQPGVNQMTFEESQPGRPPGLRNKAAILAVMRPGIAPRRPAACSFSCYLQA
jgi:hypothetical protein